MTSIVELKEYTEHVKQRARQTVESGEQVQTKLFALTPHGIDIIPITEGMRPVYKSLVCTLLRQLQADACVTITEVWACKNPTESRAKRLRSGEIKVSDLPLDDRQEMLVVVAVKNGEFHEHQMATIITMTDDRRILGEWKTSGKLQGRMFIKEW